MTEEAARAAEAAAEVSDPVDQEKCIKQLALTANRKPKYPLCHQAIDLFIAGNATQSTNQRDFK